jgi:hypothetical protein
MDRLRIPLHEQDRVLCRAAKAVLKYNARIANRRWPAGCACAASGGAPPPPHRPTDQPINQPTDQPTDQPTHQTAGQPADRPTDQADCK